MEFGYLEYNQCMDEIFFCCQYWWIEAVHYSRKNTIHKKKTFIQIVKQGKKEEIQKKNHLAKNRA